MSIDPFTISLKVGFEIHQQLSTKTKLFCSCLTNASNGNEINFTRRLRPAFSELGEYDVASMFEFGKGKVMRYIANEKSSCLVEMDEEPPHDINNEALESALIIALALKASIVDEIHVMRKIVIDGSNTSGFQRTMLIATDGMLKVKDKNIKVQSICLEEDAARIISDENNVRTYALDRLGIPLIEIALEPVTASIDQLVEVALTLGRLLRVSKRVARGLGTIRQDVNISIMNGNVVEIKGVQRLDQLRKVIEYEMYRQHAMLLIKKRLEDMNIKFNYSINDVTDTFSNTQSKVIKKVLEQEGVIKAITLKGFKGILSYEPYPKIDVRLGKELSELVRFYGLGGIFHSDELPAYGISIEEVNTIKSSLNLSIDDAFILLAGNTNNVDKAIEAIIDRIEKAFTGVVAETRAATVDGKTVYSRPRPGAARMYPETDIPPIVISDDMLATLKCMIPKDWDEYVNDLSAKYGINKILAMKLLDSDYLDIFEEIANSCKNIQPSFIASTLTETMVSLEREGYDVSSLDNMLDVFKRIDEQRIAKESILDVLRVMLKQRCDVDTAIKMLGLESISDEEMIKIIDKIIDQYSSIIKEKKEQAFGMLMGKAMEQLRGKVDGKKVSMLIKQKIASKAL